MIYKGQSETSEHASWITKRVAGLRYPVLIMELTALSCTNYKAFHDRVDLELRPLTVLLGKNNAGKSSLLRLVPQLLHAFTARAEAHLDLNIEHIEYGGTFRDLIYRRSPHGAVQIGASFVEGDEQLAIDASIQNVTPRLQAEYSVVSRWRAQGVAQIDLAWQASPEMPPVYRGDYRPQFRGLWPLPVEPGAPQYAALAPWEARLGRLFRQLSYLGPLREPVPRFCQVDRRARLGWRGEGAPQLLEAHDQLLDAVGHWYAVNMEGWEPIIDHAGGAFSVMLRRGDTAVNMADTGQGMSQVLPVVVQQYLHRVTEEPPSLYLVEQPELHLHPAAHGALADLFIDNVKQSGARMIIETHSENFLLRLRRRIAERTLASEDVALHWVDELPEGASCVRTLQMRPDGDIPDWPEGVFSEGYREVVAMRRAAREASRPPQSP